LWFVAAAPECDKPNMPSRSSAHQSSPFLIGLAGALAMAGAMGFGRFVYTPILPGMMDGAPLSAADAGLIAGANFAGYLLGAILAAYSWAAGRERGVALAGLSATAILLLAMAVTDSVPVFLVIRFLAGLASAFAMIFTSSIVLAHASRAEAVQILHFGGVGLGIALSSALVLVINSTLSDGSHGWRWEWAASAATVAVLFAIVLRFLPHPGSVRAAGPEPALFWRRPLILMTISYGLFGFGYVITATFLVTMARTAAAGPMIEFLAWFVAGIAAAVSLIVWRPFLRRFGTIAAYAACIGLEAAGILASVLLAPAIGALVGGFFLGITFMAVTAYGLQIGRILAPESPRRAMATLTAAFGAGQILGPLVAGWIAERTGGFTLPTVLAVLGLVVATILVLPLLRRAL
jgi:MFS family permease